MVCPPLRRPATHLEMERFLSGGEGQASRVCPPNTRPLLWDNQMLFLGASGVTSVPGMSCLHKRPLSLSTSPTKHVALICLVIYVPFTSGRPLTRGGKYKETTLDQQAIFILRGALAPARTVLPSRRNLVQRRIPCDGGAAHSFAILRGCSQVEQRWRRS